MIRPTLTVADDGRPEFPNGSTLSLARLVCEHGVVLWVAFGPSHVALRTDESPDAKKPCACQPSIAAIYPAYAQMRTRETG